MKIVIGSRGSKLALAQSELVREALMKAQPDLEVEIEVIHTKGDKILDKPLNQIGDKGLFTKEIEAKLLDGSIDLAVHSMKDMPGSLPDGLCFAGTLKPADARDCLIFNHNYTSLDELPLGAVVGTGSPRRKYQLLSLRPDLNIVGIRGNVQTRLAKMESENMDAIILALAGLERLDISDLKIQPFEFKQMVPACCQGILALEVKEGSSLLSLLQLIEDHEGTQRMHLERAFLNALGGSCHLPIGAHITLASQGMTLDAVYGLEDGQNLHTYHGFFEEVSVENVERVAHQLKLEVENHG